jgi:hypothetical protein
MYCTWTRLVYLCGTDVLHLTQWLALAMLLAAALSHVVWSHQLGT